MGATASGLEQAGELKMGQVGVANLRVRTLDIERLAAEMRERVDRAPALFARAAVIVDFGELSRCPDAATARALLDALRDAGAKPFGIEVDGARAAEAREKGHAVQRANFLETVPTGDYDRVVMNPPFYGTHYARHVEHALRYLHPNGVLTAILPATARYDHGLLSGSWEDLPVGAFSESGTNVNTCILTLRRPADPG